MKKGRFVSRVLLGGMVLWQLVVTRKRRPKPYPQRILIVHHLLIGDTIMLTPLLAKLRQQYPAAEIVMTVRPSMVALYQAQPYGVTALAYDPSESATLRALWRWRDFDLAIVPGDNRFSWLARGLGAKWIVAFAGDRPSYKSWCVDELKPYPMQPAAWGDMVAMLVPGAPPLPYDASDWSVPASGDLQLLPKPYVILHVGASSSLRFWSQEKWRMFATWLNGKGYCVVWSAGPNESQLIEGVDPEKRYRSIVDVSLPHLWCYLAQAAMVVCPDTGIAHLARVTNTPAVVLYGPGSPVLFGAGEFWQNSCHMPVTIQDFPCRDQNSLFKREIAWVRRCSRSVRECASPACMMAITVEQVQEAVINLLSHCRNRPVVTPKLH